MDNIVNNNGSMKNDFNVNFGRKSTFQILPLDVNLAKIQFSLQKRLSMEVPENGDFFPVIEKYSNEDSRLNISDLKIICKSSETDKDTRKLMAEIVNMARTKNYSYELFTGNKKGLLDYINSCDNRFFETTKEFVNFVSEQNERKL